MYDRAWLHEFALRTREVTLAFAVENSCILSTRVGLTVLEHFGVKARAQPVTAAAYNEEGWRLASNRVPVSQWPQTAWAVGIEGSGISNSETRAWDGHLVLIVSNPSRTRTLIDLTADQMDRPARGIHIGGPVFMDIEGMWTPKDPRFTLWGEEEGAARTIVMYRPQVTAGSWKDAPDWAGSDKHKAWRQHMIEHVIKELGDGPQDT